MAPQSLWRTVQPIPEDIASQKPFAGAFCASGKVVGLFLSKVERRHQFQRILKLPGYRGRMSGGAQRGAAEVAALLL